MPVSHDFDAIVIGAGHNGLTAQAIWEKPACEHSYWNAATLSVVRQ